MAFGEMSKSGITLLHNENHQAGTSFVVNGINDYDFLIVHYTIAEMCNGNHIIPKGDTRTYSAQGYAGEGWKGTLDISINWSNNTFTTSMHHVSGWGAGSLSTNYVYGVKL